MSNKGQMLQDPFLNTLRKEHVQVSIYLVNGIKLQGQIESFDQYVVLLKNTVTQMVYIESFLKPSAVFGPASLTLMSTDRVERPSSRRVHHQQHRGDRHHDRERGVHSVSLGWSSQSMVGLEARSPRVPLQSWPNSWAPLPCARLTGNVKRCGFAISAAM